MPAFGRYTLLRRVAVGGMAEIWKAKAGGAAGFQKTLAIKRVLPHLAEDAEFVEMFVAEAKLVAELAHPNIVQVFDFGDAGRHEYYLAMEYVAGTNVSKLRKRAAERGGAIPPGVAIYVASECCKGLAYAHTKTDAMGTPLGLVHRDISPQNILISYGGDVKVTDFGIAKASSALQRTEAGQIRGKLSYMSPEQAKGQPVDWRSDLFALGIVFYEMLTGTRLFGGNSESEIFGKIVAYRGPDAMMLGAVAPAVQPLIGRALALDPNARFQSGVEMERALSGLLGTDGLVRARQAVVSMMTSLFAEEKRVEMTPIPDAEADGAGVAALPDSAISPAGALESYPPAELETSVSPISGKSKSGVSGLTLDQPSKSHVRYVRLATTPPRSEPKPSRSPLLLFAVGLSIVSMGIAITLAVMMMHQRGGPPPAPAPTPAATATAHPSGHPSSGSHH